MLAAQSSFRPTRILVPIDFSPSSDAALVAAEDLAEHFQACLVLLHVIPAFPITTGIEFPTTFYPRDEFLEGAHMRAKALLQTKVAELSEMGLQARFVVEVGNDVVGNVLAVVEREKVDMVVLSTHGISGWRPMIFGSTAEKVVKLLECPLLLLHSPRPAIGA